MSHLDEGTLHALLDGELASSEMMEIEAHLDGCSACSARLRAAREFLEEADRLVGSVQFGRFAAAATPAAAGAAPQRQEKVAAAAPLPHPRPQTPPPPPSQPSPPPREHHRWEEPEEPVLLIPDNPEASPLLSRWPRVLGWAAALTFTVSAGFLINNLARETGSSAPAAPAAAGTVATVSQQELDPGSRATPGTRSDSSVVAPTALADAKAASAPSPADKPPAAKAATPVKAEQPKSGMAKDTAKATGQGAILARAPAKTKAANEKSVSDEDSADAAEEAATRAAEQDAIRAQAARALSQLDRERRVQRANAATAQLDRVEASRVAPVAAPPPPPTPEQKSQIYLRIGLDEASRQLGGPVHVIEGMSPLFMGLAPGRVTPGADTTRPVVRVVYQDPQGRLIMLDQQRNRPGQPAAPPATGSWTLGDLMMRLSGEAPPEVLRSLRGRVR